MFTNYRSPAIGLELELKPHLCMTIDSAGKIYAKKKKKRHIPIFKGQFVRRIIFVSVVLNPKASEKPRSDILNAKF